MKNTSEMTDYELSVEIATFLGYDIAYGEIVTIEPDKNGEPSITSHRPIPDYPNDLNAMHIAERNALLNDIELRNSYIWFLGELDFPQTTYFLTTATARQRAEAFVETMRTTGKAHE